jgi:hypothetical protein
MFPLIPSVESILQDLLPAFTAPSFQTHLHIFLGWMMCLGRRTEYGVFQTIQGDDPAPGNERHPFDRFYNFFNRSAWTAVGLAREVAITVVTRLNPKGRLYVVVDDTLLHKRGRHVYALGWFRDAVASTPKQVVTAPGNHWVVMGLSITIPGTNLMYLLPLHAKLHLPGEGQASEADLAREMLQDLLEWFPDRQLVLVGDGAYAANNLLLDLDERVTYAGVIRCDAALYDLPPATQPKGKRGPKPKKGARLPSPREAARKADRNRSGKGPWVWRAIEATIYGETRQLQVLSYIALWPKVLKTRPILVVVVRDPKGKLDDKYLFTTDTETDLDWVIETFARRWTIEVAFKASKQVLTIQAPRHWSQQSIEKLAPWVWLMQSVVSVWYLTEGRKQPEARQIRRRLGEWETEWSFDHMFRVFRRVTLRQTITLNSPTKADLLQLIDQLESYLNLAA